jgi:tRNA uridine 5-carboxymethylaminomethyl modification enzyme
MRLKSIVMPANAQVNDWLTERGLVPLQEPQSLARMLCRPELSISEIWRLSAPPEAMTFEEGEQIEIALKYQGYIERQERDVMRFRAAESRPIPEDFDYATVSGLPRESVERLNEVRPANFGQVLRVPGVRASDVAALHICLEKRARSAQKTA